MTELIGIAAVAVVAWFAAGTIWNIRVGRRVMRWMQEGLPLIGARTTVRWLGSSAAEMVIRDGKDPFTAVTLIIFLEPRDVPWLWVLGRARGRRDTLIIRGTLRAAPRAEFEAFDPETWSGREALARVPTEWPRHEGKDVIVHGADAALAQAKALLEVARQAGMRVMRLSLRRTEPNFQLHVSLPDPKAPARAFFEAVRALASRALA